MWLDQNEKIHAPEVGRAWINSSSLTLRHLRGNVVLVDFWDYTCVNCIRTLPYVQEWHRRYRTAGLTVIGVHTPEFDFAREPAYVERAARRFGIEYPVVLDNDYQIWQAYSNRCWPAKYLVDRDGYVRYYHFGEGSYGQTEAAIQKLLRERDSQTTLPELMDSATDGEAQGAQCLPVTPELYLGFSRGRLGNESGYAERQVKDYHAGSNYLPAHAYLDGPWFAGSESIDSCPVGERPSRILLSYTAAEVNLVMSPAEAGNALVSISVNGKPPSGQEAGEDLDWQDGSCAVKVHEPRMYRLIRTETVNSGLLDVSTLAPGLQAYAFTFGSCGSGR